MEGVVGCTTRLVKLKVLRVEVKGQRSNSHINGQAGIMWWNLSQSHDRTMFQSRVGPVSGHAAEDTAGLLTA